MRGVGHLPFHGMAPRKKNRYLQGTCYGDKAKWQWVNEWKWREFHFGHVKYNWK